MVVRGFWDRGLWHLHGMADQGAVDAVVSVEVPWLQLQAQLQLWVRATARWLQGVGLALCARVCGALHGTRVGAADPVLKLVALDVYLCLLQLNDLLARAAVSADKLEHVWISQLQVTLDQRTNGRNLAALGLDT